MKVLIIDDSRATRSFIKRMLTNVGFETFEADNGQTALMVLSENRDIDLALVDWNMPVMNGLEFVKTVRQEPECEELLIMMVTTETEMDRVMQAVEAGANEYLMKPFTEDLLKEKLDLLGCLPLEEECD